MITKQQILEHFGLDENDDVGRYVDFDALARSLETPTKVAVCHILGKDGKIVISNGKAVKVYREVQVGSEQELKGLVFVEWWD